MQDAAAVKRFDPSLLELPSTDWAAVIVAVAAGVVAALQVGKATIGLPAIQADLGLTLDQAGWIMGVVALVGFLGGIPAGAAASRLGDRRSLVLGLLTLAAGSVLGAFSRDLAVLLAARIVEGAGLLLIVVAAPAILDRVVSPSRRSLAFGLWGTFMPAGIAIALLTGLLVEDWRNFWFASAALAVVVGAVALIVISAPAPIAEAPSWHGLARHTRATVKAGGPLLLAVLFALYNVQYFALAGFLPILLMERMDVSIGAAGVLAAIVIAANIVGNLAAGILLGLGVRPQVLLVATSLTTGLAGLAIFAARMPAPAVLAACILFSGVAGLLPATVLSAAPRLAPAPFLAPIAMGLVVQGGNFGQIVGPVAIGYIVDAAGWPAAALPVAAASLLSIVATAVFRGKLVPH